MCGKLFNCKYLYFVNISNKHISKYLCKYISAKYYILIKEKIMLTIMYSPNKDKKSF